MAHYLILQNNAGRYMDQQVVAPESIALMHTPPAGINSAYAMGWTESALHDRRMLEHNGVLSTFLSDAVLLPDDGLGIAVLYDVSSFPTNTFAEP